MARYQGASTDEVKEKRERCRAALKQLVVSEEYCQAQQQLQKDDMEKLEMLRVRGDYVLAFEDRQQCASHKHRDVTTDSFLNALLPSNLATRKALKDTYLATEEQHRVKYNKFVALRAGVVMPSQKACFDEWGRILEMMACVFLDAAMQQRPQTPDAPALNSNSALLKANSPPAADRRPSVMSQGTQAALVTLSSPRASSPSSFSAHRRNSVPCFIITGRQEQQVCRTLLCVSRQKEFISQDGLNPHGDAIVGIQIYKCDSTK